MDSQWILRMNYWRGNLIMIVTNTQKRFWWNADIKIAHSTTMLSMQTPVFLTEPPQMQDSPTPRRRKKRTRRRNLALESRSGGWDSGRESGRDSPRSVDLSLAPKRAVRGPPDRVYRGQELDLTIVPEKLSSSEKPAKGQDTSRSVRSIFEPWHEISNNVALWQV